MTLTRRTARWNAVALLLTLPAVSFAQVKHPQPPKEYDVSLRFQIRAPLPGWYDRYDEMLAALKQLGLNRPGLPPGEQVDPSDDRISGSIASNKAHELLRHEAVKTVLLRPHVTSLKASDRVRVRLELASGMAVSKQRLLSRQVMEKLETLGFREALGYDHRGFTWIVGNMEVARLDELLRDLRTVPGGWLVPQSPVSTLPMPIRNQVPIRVIEVIPEPSDVPPVQELVPVTAFPEDQRHLAKLSPELRALASKEGDDKKYLRVEAILARTPGDMDYGWERLLRNTASSVVVEGRLGNIATLKVRATQAGEVARPDGVLHVRLPRSGEPVKRPATGVSVNAVEATRLNLLHERGFRGRGIKVAVVAGDFGGWDGLRGRELPKNTTLIDFTAPRNASIEPDPMPSSDGALGSGTLAAMTVHKAAPEADLLLVRIDPNAPHQLLLVAQIVNEPGTLPRVLEERYNELLRDRAQVDQDRIRFIDERKKAIAEQVFDEGDPKVPEQRKRFLESQERIKKAEENIKELATRDAEVQKRTQNFLLRRSDLQELTGTRVVVSPLTWDTGYPLDGGNALARYLDERPFVGHPGKPTRSRLASLTEGKGTVWVQAAGDTRGQVWTGLFRDLDGNGAMEFGSDAVPLPKNRWTSELNFLAWEDFTGKKVPDLPQTVRLRVTMQWREPHDAALYSSLDDPYRVPNANLSLFVMKQRDPNGSKLASDDLDLIARTTGTPVRLQLAPTSGTYEVTTEFEAVAGGRFALRVEGRLPNSTRPTIEAAASDNLPLEIRPRIIVEVVDASSRAKGRVVFMDYSDDAAWPAAATANPQPYGGVGMPGDARSALTVGAADASGKPQPYSSVGAGPGRDLLAKPNFLGYDAIELPGQQRVGGSWVATAFNGGLVACLIDMDAPAQTRQLLQLLRLAPGSVLRVPEDWLK